MQKRVQIALTAIFATVGFSVIWVFVYSSQEPVYRGKTLSEWLEGCDKSHWVGTEWRDSTAAVQQIGTNAIPTLLHKLRQEDSPFTLKLISLVERQHFILIRIRHVSAAAQNHKAAVGFEALGPAAQTAVPELVRILGEGISADSQSETATSLGWIGPAAIPAIPALLCGLTNATQDVRFQTVRALLQLHAQENPNAVDAFVQNNAQPFLVVPALANCLTKASTDGRRIALKGLVGYHSTGFPSYRYFLKPAIPSLMCCLSDESNAVQEQATDVLGWLGTDAKAAVPALVQLLNSPNEGVRFHAKEALQGIDPEAAARVGVK